MNAATNVNEVSSPSRAEADQSEPRLGLSTNNKPSVRIVEDYASVKRLEEFWEATNWNPNAQMEFFQLINDTRNLFEPNFQRSKREAEIFSLLTVELWHRGFLHSASKRSLMPAPAQEARCLAVSEF
jgi:hypothetical protein